MAGRKSLVRVFGVDAHFDGVAVDRQLRPAPTAGFAGCNAQLPFDQILAGDGLGNQVLHLQPGVHFHEIELAAEGVENEFDGASADVTNRLGGVDHGVAHHLALLLAQAGAGASSSTLMAALREQSRSNR